MSVRALIRTMGVVTGFLLCALPIAFLRAQEQGATSLSSLDLDELARIRVTSVSRRSESLANASAAVTVITRDDIRRSGATSIPEALRLVPGMQVARASSREFAVSARGFNDVSSNKFLVMVDGRAIYSPLFAGVFWGSQQVNLVDVDRIEVIRGPGAALWGANAVNGVINIITRPGVETLGGRVSGSVGTADYYAGNLRYGLALGRGLTGRVYGLGLSQNMTVQPSGDPTRDQWWLGQAGFRLDWAGRGGDVMTVTGDLHRGVGEQRVVVADSAPPFTRVSTSDHQAGGGSLLWRYEHRISEHSDMSGQVYFDRFVTEKRGQYGRIAINTLDGELSYRHQLGRRHDLLWGLGYRTVWDHAPGEFPIRFDPAERTTHLVSGFLQDNVLLVPERLALTLGTKLEHNSYSGLEYQPTIRAIWTPDLSTAIWGAVSRALRAPSRLDADVVVMAQVFDAPPRTAVAVFGSRDFAPEILMAYEAGVRATPHEHVALELSLFYNDYDRLRTVQQRAPDNTGPLVVIPYVVTNWARGNSYGGDASLTLQLDPRWRVRLNYSYLQMKVEVRDDAPSTTLPDIVPGLNPEHQGSIWSSLDVAGGVELDLIGRYVSPLPGATPDVPGYVEADARLGIRLTRGAMLSFVGQDLLHARHREFRTPTSALEVRSVQRRAYVRFGVAF